MSGVLRLWLLCCLFWLRWQDVQRVVRYLFVLPHSLTIPFPPHPCLPGTWEISTGSLDFLLEAHKEIPFLNKMKKRWPDIRPDSRHSSWERQKGKVKKIILLFKYVAETKLSPRLCENCAGCCYCWCSWWWTELWWWVCCETILLYSFVIHYPMTDLKKINKQKYHWVGARRWLTQQRYTYISPCMRTWVLTPKPPYGSVCSGGSSLNNGVVL